MRAVRVLLVRAARVTSTITVTLIVVVCSIGALLGALVVWTMYWVEVTADAYLPEGATRPKGSRSRRVSRLCEVPGVRVHDSVPAGGGVGVAAQSSDEWKE